MGKYFWLQNKRPTFSHIITAWRMVGINFCEIVCILVETIDPTNYCNQKRVPCRPLL